LTYRLCAKRIYINLPEFITCNAQAYANKHVQGEKHNLYVSVLLEFFEILMQIKYMLIL